MSKEYRYRKHIRWMQYTIPAMFGIPIIVLGFSAFSIWRNSLVGGVEFLNVFPPVISCIILLFLLEIGFLWWIFYRMAGTVISINENGVVYKVRRNVKLLPFENLRIDSASIRYTGGWLKLISGKDVIRLTVVLEDISGFILELKNALDTRGFSSHYDPNKLFGFMKTAVAGDQNWNRFYSLFGKFYLSIFVVVITLVNGYVFGIIPWGFVFIIAWGIFTLIWATGAYTVAEIRLMRKIAKESNEQAFTFPQRDMAYEKQVFNDAINWGGWLYFGISLITLTIGIAIKLYLVTQSLAGVLH
jgi:hypothetical protein